MKPGSGCTGVEYRYYTTKEYNKLTKEQKDELRDHRKEKDSKGNPDKSGGGYKKKLKATVASVVKELQKSEEKKNDELTELKSIISSRVITGKEGKKSNAESEPVQYSEQLAEIAAVKLQKLMSGNKGRKSGRS